MYQSAAVILLNFVVLLVLVNLLLGAGYLVADVMDRDPEAPEDPDRLFREDGAPVETPRRTEEMMEWFDFGAFEDVPPEAAGQMLDDFHDLAQLGFAYQPWVQFAEPPFDGQRVHVDVDTMGFPIRRTVNPEREDAEKVVRIFAMGGSTTFGYWVSDRHTWPSHLSRILNRRAEEDGLPIRVEVVNYGRGYYYPTQESVLLADLLRSGHRPSLVIFMDGVNLGGRRDVPHFNPEIARAFSTRQHGVEVTEADFVEKLDWIPMVRAVWSARLWYARSFGPSAADGGGFPEAARLERARHALDRFRRGRETSRATCGIYGCETLFFLQPNAHYRYDLDLYRRELPPSFTRQLRPTEFFYEEMRRDGGYTDLSGLFREWGPDRKAVVDYVHYSPGFGRFLAERVASHIDLDALPVFPGGFDEEQATGPPRPIVSGGEWLEPETGWERTGQ